MTGSMPIDDAAIAAGIVVAHTLDIPLSIGGKKVTVTAEMAAPFDRPRPAPAEPADPFYEPPSNLEIVRRAMFLVARLEAFINETGVDLGLIERPRPSDAAWPTDTLPTCEPESEVEYQPKVVNRRDGTAIVDGWLEVRSETGVAYHVVVLTDNRLAAWLPDRQKAIDYAIALAKKHRPPHRPGDSLTWETPQEKA